MEETGTQTYFPKSCENQNLGAVLMLWTHSAAFASQGTEDWTLYACIFLGLPMEGDHAKKRTFIMMTE